jgi:hypothetical protein
MFYHGELENHMVMDWYDWYDEPSLEDYEEDQEEDDEEDVEDEAICELCKYGLKNGNGDFIDTPKCKGCARGWCEIFSNFESKDGFEYEIKGGELVRKEKR